MKKILIITLTLLMVFSLCSVSVLAVTEGEVQSQVAAQGKENLPTNEIVTVFTDEEIEKLKEECFKTWGTGKRLYQQSAAYILMLNTGIRTGEMLGLLNSDIDILTLKIE